MGRSIADLMTGILGQVEARKASAAQPPASQAEDLKQKLETARAAGDTDAASAVLDNITKRREELLKTGLVTETAPKRGRRVRTSVVPSNQEIKDMLTAKAAKLSSPSLPTINATREQMRDIQGEIDSWGGAPTSPGQWTPTTLAETKEAKEIAASPEGPETPPANLASVLMDKLEAHHADLTRLLKNLPDQLRAHAQHSPYFGPAHDHFANQLESRGEVTSFGQSDRDALREKRDLIEQSEPTGSKHEIRQRNAILERNYAAMTYGEAGSSYIQDVPAGPIMQKSLERKASALKDINAQISAEDVTSMKNVPSHIQALTVGLPARLGALKAKMNEIRENGTFKTDDPKVNHKAVGYY
jgi:hypothetical protein